MHDVQPGVRSAWLTARIKLGPNASTRSRACSSVSASRVPEDWPCARYQGWRLGVWVTSHHAFKPPLLPSRQTHRPPPLQPAVTMGQKVGKAKFDPVVRPFLNGASPAASWPLRRCRLFLSSVFRTLHLPRLGMLPAFPSPVAACTRVPVLHARPPCIWLVPKPSSPLCAAHIVGCSEHRGDGDHVEQL